MRVIVIARGFVRVHVHWPVDGKKDNIGIK